MKLINIGFIFYYVRIKDCFNFCRVDAADDGGNSFVRKKGDTYEIHQWKNIEGSQRIYEIGNHILNTEERGRGPNAPMSETIIYGKDGDMSLSYGQLTSVLTKAIQEQLAKIFLIRQFLY